MNICCVIYLQVDQKNWINAGLFIFMMTSSQMDYKGNKKHDDNNHHLLTPLVI